jgi:hypothetical protein
MDLLWRVPSHVISEVPQSVWKAFGALVVLDQRFDAGPALGHELVVEELAKFQLPFVLLPLPGVSWFPQGLVSLARVVFDEILKGFSAVVVRKVFQFTGGTVSIAIELAATVTILVRPVQSFGGLYQEAPGSYKWNCGSFQGRDDLGHELHDSFDILGGGEDVARVVGLVLQRLGLALNEVFHLLLPLLISLAAAALCQLMIDSTVVHRFGRCFLCVVYDCRLRIQVMSFAGRWVGLHLCDNRWSPEKSVLGVFREGCGPSSEKLG